MWKKKDMAEYRDRPLGLAGRKMTSKPYRNLPDNVFVIADEDEDTTGLHVLVYMFRAICKFTQFRNCAAQIRNCENGNQFQNWNPILKWRITLAVRVQEFCST